MGRGGAQLGKALKGKSKHTKRRQANDVANNVYGVAMDARMLEEYERLSMLAEQQKQYLKKRALNEATISAANAKHLMALFRQVLRGEKIDQLRSELEILSANHNRDFMRYDERIENEVLRLLQADEQYLHTQRIHMNTIHKLTDMHKKSIISLQNEWNEMGIALQNEFLSERMELITQHQRNVRAFTHILSTIEQNVNETQNENAQRHETEREELRNKNLEAMNELRLNLEAKIEELERSFEEIHRQYLNQTQTISQHFSQLKADDAVCSANIAEKKKKVIKLQMAINNWKKKNEWNIKEGQARNAALKVAKNEMDAHCVELKTKMAKYRAAEGQKLAQMTSLARQAQQQNQFKLKQAERILTMAELVAKLETENEKGMIEEWRKQQQRMLNDNDEIDNANKIVTINDENGFIQQPEETKTNDAIVPFTQDTGNVLTEVNAYRGNGERILPENALEGFYNKYNKVQLDCLALETEKSRLRDENSHLRMVLQQYLTSISLPNENADNMSKSPTSNGLLTISSRAPVIPNMLAQTAHAIRERPSAVIREASAIMHTYEMHITGRR